MPTVITTRFASRIWLANHCGETITGTSCDLAIVGFRQAQAAATSASVLGLNMMGLILVS